MARRAPEAAHVRSNAQSKTLQSLLTQQAWFLQHIRAMATQARRSETAPRPLQNAQAHSCSRIQFNGVYNSEHHTRARSDRQLVQLVLMSRFSFAAILRLLGVVRSGRGACVATKTLQFLLTQAAWFLKHTCVPSQDKGGARKKPHRAVERPRTCLRSRIHLAGSAVLSDHVCVAMTHACVCVCVWQMPRAWTSAEIKSSVLFPCLVWLVPDGAFVAIRRATQNIRPC